MSTAGSGALAPADTLATRTYLGLLAAQFLAAFNDQAIHAAAMFFAINTQTLSEANAIALMPILFYAPWALCCTLAGYLADRYSKRTSLVAWKIAEIGITGLALFGFWLGTGGGQPHAGSWVVLSTVFLMGTHSAFFVLESLSFLAVILGTVSGGILSFVFLRREANIGIILLCLAVVGAIASLFIRRMPAANPTLRFPRYLYGPLARNLKTLLWSRTLAFAVIGIAFFTFIVAFMRATVYMFGQSQNPKWDELKTSAVVGTVALGVGLGSPLAGWLSGRRVELGLIPIGATGMILGCVLAGFSLGFIPGLIACTVLIGVCTGFYLVPLFTLLQYRAPKSSKGDMIASSNFINVTGAILASVLFSLVVTGSKKAGLLPRIETTDRIAEGELTSIGLLRGRPVYFKVNGLEVGSVPTDEQQQFNVFHHLFDARPVQPPPDIKIDRSVKPHDDVIVSRYHLGDVDHYVIRPAAQAEDEEYDERPLPKFLFLGAGIMTLGVLLVLWRRVRDLPRRAATLLASLIGSRYVLNGLVNVPGDGPVVLLIDTNDAKALQTLTTAVDRYVHVMEPKAADELELELAMRTLHRGDVIGILMSAPAAGIMADTLGGLRIRVRVDGRQMTLEEPTTTSQ
jgi:MFS family permease